MNQLSCHVQTSNGIKRPTMSELVMEQACGLLSESFQTQALVTEVRAAQFAAASETLEISLMPSPGGQEKDVRTVTMESLVCVCFLFSPCCSKLICPKGHRQEKHDAGEALDPVAHKDGLWDRSSFQCNRVVVKIHSCHNGPKSCVCSTRLLCS